MKKNLAILAGLCLTGLFSVDYALAGSWEQVYNEEAFNTPAWEVENAKRLRGELHWSVPSNWATSLPGQTQVTIPWAEIGDEGAGFMASLLAVGGEGGSGIAYSEGERRTKYKWVRNQINGVDDPNDNPPPVLYVRVDGSASIDAYNSAGESFGATLTTTVDDQSGTGVYQGSGTWIDNNVKSVLLQIKTYGAEEVWVPWVIFKSRGTISANGNSGTWVGITGSLSYYSSIDHRGVKIVSPSIENPFSYYKAYASGLPVQEIHQRDEVDAMVVSKAATKRIITLADLSKKVRWYGGAELEALTSGFTTPTYSWDLDQNKDIASGDELTVVDYTHYNPFGPWTLVLSEDTLPPGTKTDFKVRVTDADGAVGSNTYTIQWHKPFENYIDDPNDSDFPREGYNLWPSDVINGTIEAGAAINGSTGATATYKKVLLTQLSDWAETGTGLYKKLDFLGLASPYVEGITEILVDLGILGDFDHDEGTSMVLQNSSDMFNKAVEITEAGHNSLVPAGADYDDCYLTSPLFYVKYQVRHLIGDTYGQNGYLGQDDRLVGSDNDGTSIYGRGWTGIYERITP